MKQFQDEHNLEIHGTTKQVSQILYEQEEINHLNSLPYDSITGELKRYVGFKEVTSDCLISFKGNKYSVPHYFTSKEVWICVLYGTLQIYSSKNKLIATHTMNLGKGEVVINKEHFQGYRTNNQFDSMPISINRLLKRFSGYTNIHKFIDNVKVQKRINDSHHLFKIANLFEYYDDTDCIMAMEECITLNVYNYNIIKGHITHYKKPKPEQLNLFNIELPIQY